MNFWRKISWRKAVSVTQKARTSYLLPEPQNWRTYISVGKLYIRFCRHKGAVLSFMETFTNRKAILICKLIHVFIKVNHYFQYYDPNEKFNSSFIFHWNMEVHAYMPRLKWIGQKMGRSREKAEMCKTKWIKTNTHTKAIMTV